MLTLHKNTCGNYPMGCADSLDDNFINSNEVNFVALSKKVRDTGLFGLLDKSKKYANILNDIHYLKLYLQMIHKEKIEDSINCDPLAICSLSFHPNHYISKYNLDKIYKRFKCYGIDITSYLSAYNIDKLYRYKKLYYAEDKRTEDCFDIVSVSDFVMCPAPIEEVVPTEPVRYEPICCIVPPEPEVPEVEVPDVVIPPVALSNSCVYSSPETTLDWFFNDEIVESAI